MEFIKKNLSIISIGIIIILSLFILKQCDSNKQTELINKQNELALKDSSYQLVLTKEKLKLIDSSLYKAVSKIDSLSTLPVKEVIKIKIKYVPRDVIVDNTVQYDSLTKKGSVSFTSNDSVRSFDAISYFNIDTSNHKISLVHDKSEVKNFKFNFDLICYKELDRDGNIVVKVKPFYIDKEGNLIKEISTNTLNIGYRSVLLQPSDFPVKPSSNKLRLESGWGLTLTPLAVGLSFGPKGVQYGFTPNIGFSYYLTLKRK
jgi:hypothetical protein